MLVAPTGKAKLKNYLKRRVFLGNEPTPELIAIVLVYFVQGILGLASLAVSFFLKDELGIGPVEVSVLMGFAMMPWMVKPLFGFISDGLPILGYRRRPYLIAAGVMGALSWVSLATWVDGVVGATVAIALGSISTNLSDVIADSLVAERARKESLGNIGSLQSLCWGSMAFGGIITAYFSGLLLEYFSSQTVFLVTATFPLIVSAVAWLITEKKVNYITNFKSVKKQIGLTGQAISNKSILLPAAFILLWQATPTSAAAFFYFTTNELGFKPEFLGRVNLVTSIAGLVGVWLFYRYLKSIPFRQIFGWSAVISAVLGMTVLLLVTHANRALGIDDHWFSLGDSTILAIMGKITWMPLFVLAARLCPKGVEATLFAVLMSVINFGGFLSYQSGALLMHWLEITESNFDNLWLLVIIANISTLLPLPFLGLLPSANALSEEEENDDNSPPVLEAEVGVY